MNSFWEHLQNLTDARAIISLGFYFLLVVVFAQCGVFFAFFLPGDYLLFMAGLLSATGMFNVSITMLVLSLILAAILGNYTGYWFGHRTGPSLHNRKDSVFFKKRYVALAEDFFIKHDAMALVLGRFFPIIRTFAPIFAGVVKFDLKKFALYNVAGSIAWVATFTLGGYFLGERFPHLKDYLQYIFLALATITAIPVVILFFRSKFQKTKVLKN